MEGMDLFDVFVNSPYFGILLAIGTYVFGAWLQKLAGGNPFVNPLLLAIIFSVIILKILGVGYDKFMIGGSYISFFIAPATVALVVNLYKNFDLLKANLLPVLVGVFVGCLTSILSAYLLSKLFGFDEQMTITMMPKSLTTAIGVSISAEYGGLAPISTIAIVLTGVSGAVFSPAIMKVLNVQDPVARGVAIGTTSHAVGTSKALEMGEQEGAMSGLSIALAGFMTVIIMPIIMNILPM